MLNVSFRGGAVDQYIIEKYKDKLANMLVKHLGHNAPKRSWCISQAERHD